MLVETVAKVTPEMTMVVPAKDHNGGTNDGEHQASASGETSAHVTCGAEAKALSPESKSACREVSVSKLWLIDPRFTLQPGERHTATSLDLEEVQNISLKP